MADEETPRRPWWEAKDFISLSYPAQMYHYPGTGVLLPVSREAWASQDWPDRPHP